MLVFRTPIMSHAKTSRTPILILLGTLLVCSVAHGEIPDAYMIDGVQRVRQLKNYCGPACMAAVMKYHGSSLTQEAIGGATYDPVSAATNGADMLFYAREQGFAAYSWNTSISDVKQKIAAQLPVIALQQNSLQDPSGHYRVLVGYDDTRSVFHVIDPYYERTEISYTECRILWRSMGYWALLILPKENDRFAAELGERNPVVHMDLAYAKYKRKDYADALAEANRALALEPRNTFALSMVDKISRAMGAGAR